MKLKLNRERKALKVKRKKKNILMGVVIALICVAMVLTGYAATQNTTSSSVGSPPSQSQSSSSQSDSSQSNNSQSDSSQSDSLQGNSSQSDNSQSDNSQSDNSQGNNSQNGQSQDNQSQSGGPSQGGQSQSGGQSQGGQSQSGSQPPSMPGGNSQQQPGQMGGSQGIGTVYLILFILEGLGLSLVALYLIMSKGNKKSFRETFRNGDKIAIYLMATIIATSVVTFVADQSTVALTSGGSQTQSQQSGNSTQVSYDATETIDEDTTLTGETVKSTTSDQNAILVTGDIEAVLKNMTVNKTGDTASGDNSNFYGNNSGITAKDGANLTVTGGTVTTDADGANGLFSFGGSATTENTSSDGTTVTVSDTKITTTGDNAGGIMTTGGGIMKASNLTINTAGTSSAAIRTDRGGGTVSVDGGSYTTTGAGSPAVYSTADITVKDAELTAKASEGVVIEGKNTVTLENCTLTDSNTKLNGQSTTYKNIFLYQSMSGDASDGTSEFTAKDSDITTNNGDSFYVTNTSATINIENNKIVNNDEDGYFLRIQKDSWGNEGSNGGTVTMNLTNQDASGDIYVDEISTLTLNLEDGSSYEGAINSKNTAKSIKLTLSKDSKITLTGDTYVSELEDADSDYSNIDFNGYTLYVDGEAIN